MLPGPTIIKKCLVCSKSIEHHTIGSGNTFGATFWTDGKREAPMLSFEATDDHYLCRLKRIIFFKSEPTPLFCV